MSDQSRVDRLLRDAGRHGQDAEWSPNERAALLELDRRVASAARTGRPGRRGRPDLVQPLVAAAAVTAFAVVAALHWPGIAPPATHHASVAPGPVAVVPTPAAGPAPPILEAGALAALAADPDIGTDDRPLLRARLGGSCERHGTGIRLEQVASSRLMSTVDASIDSDGTACVTVEKSAMPGFADEPSYMALSACNDDGRCDHDWGVYRVFAGPVRVPVGGDGCLTFRVSLRDAADTSWLVRDAIESGCFATQHTAPGQG